MRDSKAAKMARDHTTKELLIASFQNGDVPTSWIHQCRFAAKYLQETNEEFF